MTLPFLISYFFILIIFAKATKKHRSMMKKSSLTSLVLTLGKKINLSKSRLFFSKNMNKDLVKQLIGPSIIPFMNNLDKYLGVPFIHSRTTFIMF